MAVQRFQVLLADPEAAVRATAASTHEHPELLATFVAKQLAAMAGRSAGGASSSRKNSTKVRAAIRQAIKALPPHHPNTTFVIMDRIAREPHVYGVKEAPCEDTVRAELRLMQIESKPVPASLPTKPIASYSSTRSSA